MNSIDSIEYDRTQPVIQAATSEFQGKWECIKVTVDSGAVDIVGNPEGFPGIPVEQTEESKNGDYWVGPGGERE